MSADLPSQLKFTLIGKVPKPVRCMPTTCRGRSNQPGADWRQRQRRVAVCLARAFGDDWQRYASGSDGSA